MMPLHVTSILLLRCPDDSEGGGEKNRKSKPSDDAGRLDAPRLPVMLYRTCVCGLQSLSEADGGEERRLI